MILDISYREPETVSPSRPGRNAARPLISLYPRDRGGRPLGSRPFPASSARGVSPLGRARHRNGTAPRLRRPRFPVRRLGRGPQTALCARAAREGPDPRPDGGPNWPRFPGSAAEGRRGGCDGDLRRSRTGMADGPREVFPSGHRPPLVPTSATALPIIHQPITEIATTCAAHHRRAKSRHILPNVTRRFCQKRASNPHERK